LCGTRLIDRWTWKRE